MKLTVIIPTWNMERAVKLRDSLEKSATGEPDVLIVYSPNTSAVQNMQTGGDLPGDIIMFMHDDTDIDERGWDEKVVKFFEEHPRCGMAGFGGARGLGLDSLYKTKYDYHQLARVTFMSNMRDAEDHGVRVTVPTKCVVLDGFSQIFRRSAYHEVGGWRKVGELGLTFHMYDAAMACMMAEKGWEVWMIPMECAHFGGRTSTSKAYDEWLRKQGVKGDQQVHAEAHKIIYNRFRNVLPLRVEASN